MKRVPLALLIAFAGLCVLLAVMPALAPVALGARYVAQGYDPTSTPTPSRTPTPTATPRPFALTPRPTSTGLAPRPATPTPQAIAATPGPCTIVLGESSATCKTRYMQPVTWTLRLTTSAVTQRVVVTSSPFDGTSRAVFTASLVPGSVITVAPRWQGQRALAVITLTGQISGSNWTTRTHIIGSGPANAILSIRYYRFMTTTGWYRVSFYSATVGANGLYTFSIPTNARTLGPRDYWQMWHHSAGAQTADIDTIAGVLTRRMYFPIMRRAS